ncbi:MAG: hypothetical protein N3E51_03625 [Candidatus Micrarchaeota archaeon]|nr:hypothetical protein [Candidatus Micrarchaeota archaeon]
MKKNARSLMRGQALSTDAIISLSAFSILLFFIASYWTYASQSASEAYSQSRLEKSALSASDLLVKSPGYPPNWESNPQTASSIGLAQSPNRLSSPKLSALASLGYQNAKLYMGLEKDFYLAITLQNGSTVFSLGNSTFNASQSVTITRLAFLNGSAVRLRLVHYE